MCDDSFICEAFDDIENKSLFEVDALIKHYKYLLLQFRLINDWFHLSNVFKNTDERRIIKDSFTYNWEQKGVKYNQTKNNYMKVIQENLLVAENIYKIKKEESIKLRREKKKDVLIQKITCECGCLVSMRNLAVHKKTKIHLKYLDSMEMIK